MIYIKIVKKKEKEKIPLWITKKERNYKILRKIIEKLKLIITHISKIIYIF